jgi:hypothetical protein
MQSEIKLGQRFKFNILFDNPSQERHAVVTRVLSNGEEGLGPEVDFYFALFCILGGGLRTSRDRGSDNVSV